MGITPRGRVIVGRTVHRATYDVALRAFRGTPTPSCNHKLATQFGSSAADRIIGTPRADVLVGLGGADVLKGHSGKGTLCGNAGPDTLYGGPGKDFLIGGPGKDFIKQSGVHTPGTARRAAASLQTFCRDHRRRDRTRVVADVVVLTALVLVRGLLLGESIQRIEHGDGHRGSFH